MLFRPLRIEFNAHTPTAISRMDIGMNVPHSGAQLHRLCINGFRRYPAIIAATCAFEMAANIGHVKMSFLQFERDDLLLACIAMAMTMAIDRPKPFLVNHCLV